MKTRPDSSQVETVPATSAFVLPVHFAANFPIEFIVQRPVDVPLRLMRREAGVVYSASAWQTALTRLEP